MTTPAAKSLVSMFLCISLASSQYVTVPLHHQVYPLLVKGETLRMFDSYSLRVLPLTRTEVLTMLHAMKQNVGELSSTDAELVDQMFGEFADVKIGEPAGPENEIHAYRYEEGASQLFVDLRALAEIDLRKGFPNDPDENLLRITGFGSVRGHFGNQVFVDLSARNGMTLGAKDSEERFDVTQGETRSTVGSTVFIDQATGYLAANLGPLTVFLGRTTVSWGSGIQERLGLSLANEPMDQIRLSLDFRNFRFSYFHANLQGPGSPRFLAGHRLDVLLGGGVQLGAYETIVYAGRGAELSYLNPLLLYHFMEHQLGDRDNNTLGIDATAFLAPGFRVFTEVFVDDLSLDYSLSTFWGNKLAGSVGFHWAQPFEFRTLEFFATYTRVDPFVYTHTDSLNVYSHYGTSIGSRIGPNAERYSFSLLWRPEKDFFLDLAYAYTRNGKGSLFSPHRPEDGEQKNFLAGTLELRHTIAVQLRYQFSRDMFLGMEGSLLDELNSQFISGRNARGRTIRVFLDINY
ncbi:MAG: hypothetical protein HY562_06770 [Ignavibacteriales bacterium]|nr:hypothetical protein [Ignavibacteriales bacterium]